MVADFGEAGVFVVDEVFGAFFGEQIFGKILNL